MSVNEIALVFIAVGAIATAVLAYFSWRSIRHVEELERKKARGAISTEVLPAGIFFVRNESDQEVEVTVIQKRLVEDINKQRDPTAVHEIQRLVAAQQAQELARRVRDNGRTKVKGTLLGAHERIAVPMSEMHGYVAEDIYDVIIGTLITYQIRGPNDQNTKLYLHRFSGKGSSEPKLAWIQIYAGKV